MPVRTRLAAIAALALVAAACGSDTQDAGPVDTADAVLTIVSDNGYGIADAPPSELTVIDVTVGDGTEATAGDTIDVQYAGVSWSTGEMFDSSWQRDMPLSFPLGQGFVITGWDEGVAGMREGGRRLLILPPQFAYGDTGSGPIAPGETLIFVVDLVSVN